MKLLLTSSGITNPSIAKALFELVGKKPGDTSLVVIPTASNIEMGDKEWFIDDLVNLKNQQFKSIDIADISSLPDTLWKQKIEGSDVLFFEGGNTYYLMEWIKKSGLDNMLPELLSKKIYVGVSAGSMVTNPNLILTVSQVLYSEDMDKSQDMEALNLVDFYVIPHFKSSNFPGVREENIKKVTNDMGKKIYVIDDQSAVKVIDGDVEIVSEGKFLVLN